jgi:hypothetical protein
MNAENFAEWLRRQGYRVVRTASSYWYNAGPGVFQAFPYHWCIEPSERELKKLLLENSAIALRYSAPFHYAKGKISYHAVCEDRNYNLSSLPRQSRQNVRRGLEYGKFEPIPFSRLAAEGWGLRRDSLERQGRLGAENEQWWRRLCSAAEGLPGFEAIGAIHNDELVASFLAFRCDDCYTLPFEQSATAHLESRVNNAIFYHVTQEAFKRSGISSVFFCLHSLDAAPGIDQFKFRMGYTAKPVRQRVVFHPLLTPFLNTGIHALMRKVLARRPNSPSLHKAEGIFRFYLEGKPAPDKQIWPECLEPRKSELLGGLQIHGKTSESRA